MAIEIEKKYRLPIEQIEPLRKTLLEAGGKYAGKTEEENVIYGGGTLDEQAAILRVRKTPKGTTLTYKRRIENLSDVKRQIEHETEFADAGELAEILANLGFTPRIIYEKRRETWTFRNTEIVLDELPFGSYMEVEGSLTAIKEAEMLLHLDELETEHETYPMLSARLGLRSGGVIEARFR